MAVAMFWNALLALKTCRRRAGFLVFCAVVLAGSLAGLFIVHGQLDAVISVDAAKVIDRDTFVIGHRRYNQLTTVEWIASLLYLPDAISAWRKQDGSFEETALHDS